MNVLTKLIPVRIFTYFSWAFPLPVKIGSGRAFGSRFPEVSGRASTNASIPNAKNKSNTSFNQRIRAKYPKNTSFVFLLLLCVIATFPLEKVNSIFIFTLFAVQIAFIAYHRVLLFRITPFLWMLMLVFSLNIIGLLYSENLSRGFTIITRQISFILFPLFYATYRVKNITILYKVYIIATFCFIIIFEVDTLYRFFYKSDTFPLNLKLFLSYKYTGAELTRFIETHNAYLGMYITFSNVLIISFLRTVKKSAIIIALLLLVAFQSIFILQMVAKTAILLNILLVIPSVIYFLITLKKRRILFFSTILILCLGWFSLQHLNLPFHRIGERFMELKTGDNTHRSNTRIKMWEAAKPLIQDHYVFGVGTGDVRDLLHDAYAKSGLKPESNIHNQYLDYMLRFGLPGIILFLSVLFIALFKAIKTNNYSYFCFTIIIMSCCFTENILSRQWGITFYAAFNYLLYIYHPKKDK